MTRAQTDGKRSQIELSLVEATALEPLLDMMQDFNALEDIPWNRLDVTPTVQRLLGAPELGLIAHIVEHETVCGYLVLTWGFDLEWNGRDAFLTDLYLLPPMRGRGLGRKALPLIEQLYDPGYYVAYAIPYDPVVTGGVGCSAQVFVPDLDEAAAELQAALSEYTPDIDLEAEFPAIGAAYAEEVRVTCPAP